jgi:hypothetical protein
MLAIRAAPLRWLPGLKLADRGLGPLGPALGPLQGLAGLGAFLADTLPVGLGPGGIIGVDTAAAHGLSFRGATIERGRKRIATIYPGEETMVKFREPGLRAAATDHCSTTGLAASN